VAVFIAATPLQRQGIRNLNWQYGKSCDVFSLGL